MSKLFFFITLISFTNIYAQKPPSVQQISLRPPTNVKIDGKIKEWGKLQAYNPATDLFYTIANDDKKLYLTLTVNADNWPTICNIANGGIKLVIQKTGTKNDTRAPFVKFPYLEKGKRINIAPKGMQRGSPDTVMMLDNKLLNANIKWIYTKWIEGIDTLLSIYNTGGITAANAFDTERNYNLEISVDLSLFGLSVDNQSQFSYHLMVNAEPNRYTYTSVVDGLRSNSIRNMAYLGTNAERIEQTVASLENQSNKWTAPTDFWGEYTLAK